MKQKIGIVQAFMHDPELVIMDALAVLFLVVAVLWFKRKDIAVA